MRLVEEIPHHTFKVTIFKWNGRYLIKVELDQYEQTYKIGEDTVQGTDQIKKMLTEAFYESCMKRFLSMREDFIKSFKNIEYEV